MTAGSGKGVPPPSGREQLGKFIDKRNPVYRKKEPMNRERISMFRGRPGRRSIMGVWFQVLPLGRTKPSSSDEGVS